MVLGTLDIVFLVISISLSAIIGIYHGIKGLKQTSTDYLLGGRTMRPLPLAMSLTVGTVSAITIMGNAGEIYTYGTQFWLMDVGIAFGMFFVAKVFIPIFYPMKMISLYHYCLATDQIHQDETGIATYRYTFKRKYIECRFHSKWLRRATVLLTLGGAYLFIGFLLFPPSKLLQIFTGLTTTNNIIITGLACSVYSAFGGVKGVVYSDVLQSVIMLVGSIAIVLQGANNVGGLGAAWDIAYHHNRIEFFNFDLNPYQRHSFWLVITYGFFFSLSTYGVNQSQTQRAFSTTSVKEAQKVIYYAIFGMILLRGCVNLSGITIFANYANCDPLTKDPNLPPQHNIVIVIHYVMQHLIGIPGLTGLFVASIYSAVLSSVSTQVNSMTAILWEDFFKVIPFFASWDEIKVANFQKVLVFLTGVVGIFMSIITANFSDFLGALFKITGAVWGPMVGLFLLAVYFPWIKCKGATIGFIVGMAFSLWIVIGQIVTQEHPRYLDMSHDGCPYMINGTEMLRPERNFTSVVNHGKGFYGISYCLSYFWGVISCIIVAVLVTTFTGSNATNEVDEKLICPIAWRWFSKGFKKCMREQLKYFFKISRSSQTIEDEKQNCESQVEMEPIDKSNHLSSQKMDDFSNI